MPKWKYVVCNCTNKYFLDKEQHSAVFCLKKEVYMNLEKYNGCARKKTNDGKLVGHKDTCLSVLRIQKLNFFIQKMFLHA